MKEKYLRDIYDSDIVDKIKIDCQDYFELVYMRHRYFRKSKNPDPKRLAQFEEMICNISNSFFYKNYQLFNETGFESEDLRNICRVHAVSFFYLSGLAENPDKMEKFRKRHKNKYGEESEPGKRDIFRKECYDLSRFLKQRMQDFIRNCKSKNNNIRGTSNERKYFIGNKKKNPSDLDLINYPVAYGYTKISKKEFKELQQKNNAQNKNKFLTKDDKMVRAVYLTGEHLSQQDIKDLNLDPRHNLYYSNPEEALINIEDRMHLENLLSKNKRKKK